ncbi:hypothetical protein FocnCong_v021484 [Fusarium oxysporum f. sp. conglutinans]|nr:hypothetical protein FocnCong_v021484 [Fusarium oxysporum f. sp. conglutinans]
MEPAAFRTMKHPRYPTKCLRRPERDPNSTTEINTIKQKDRDFSTFYAEFQSLSLDSGLEGDVLAPFLEKAISKELFEMLLNNPPADYSYHTLVSHFRELDIAYRSTVREPTLCP